ncbi:helix-turn-helix transcriptional regulator [Streptosporangium canum]|uniref:helix-turn-helix domain-containing protein n=1 Tax=Streptosporangium canum TaxID=324952 RepID=UPI00343175C1
MTGSPAWARKQLADALKEARERCGLSIKDAAKALAVDSSKISRIENNDWKLPSLRYVDDALTVYQVTDPKRREQLLIWAEEGRQKGWWEEYRDVLDPTLLGYEAEASAIRTYEALLVPGLLQTPAYAEAVFRGGQAVDDGLIARRIEARLARKRTLERDTPPSFYAVIDEAALRKHVGGPEVMREQIQHLVTMADRPNIIIQIMPDAVGAHAGMSGPFTVLEYSTSSGAPAVVHLETAAGDFYVEERDAVERYGRRHGHLCGSALDATVSARYLWDLVGQLK